MIAEIEETVFPIALIIVQCGSVECGILNVGNAVRDRNTCKIVAGGECTAPNARDAVGERDARQAAALRECKVSDACDAVGNGDACEVPAGIKCIVSDGLCPASDRIFACIAVGL